MEESSLTPEQREIYPRVAKILMPYYQDQVARVYPKRFGSSAQFAHYTSAEAALSIIKDKCLWLRNTGCMSDYREVNHGHTELIHAFEDQALGEQLMAALEDCAPGTAQRAAEAFGNHWPNIQRWTYITCLSEHLATENNHGRLSMWRGVAPGSARVAIVVSVPFFAGITEKLRIIFSPVGYLPRDRVCAEMRRVIQNIKDKKEFLSTQVKPDILFGAIFTMFLAAVTCMKHEGFAEEMEWRAIYCPKVLPPSVLIRRELKVIGGIPQEIYKMPLGREQNPDGDLDEIDLAKILDRVIIGPTQYGAPMYDAFVDALTKLGVSNPQDRVVVSGIPIRT